MTRIFLIYLLNILNQRKNSSQNPDAAGIFKIKKLKKGLANWRRNHKEKKSSKGFY